MKSVATVVALLCAGVQFAFAGVTGVLSDENRILTVNVEEGQIAEFDPSELLTHAATVTNFVKVGKGRLDLGAEDDITAYAGTIEIRQGTYRVSVSENLGNLTTAGLICIGVVGALEYHAGTGVKINIPNKRVRVAGSGVDGAGAIIYCCEENQDQASMSYDLSLDGDVYMANTNRQASGKLRSVTWRKQGGTEPMKIKFNGHYLTYRATNGAYAFTINCPVFDAEEGGGIVACSRFQFQDITDSRCTLGGANAHIVITNNATFQMNLDGYGAQMDATLDLHEGTTFSTSGNFDPYVSTMESARDNWQRWRGPVVVHGEAAKVVLGGGGTSYDTLSFKGKVSGGGLRISEGKAFVNPQVNFYSPENDFTGGIVSSDVPLWFWTDGALPLSAGYLVMTNASVHFPGTDSYYHLPKATLMADGVVAVDGGAGVWAEELEKDGDGELTYSSRIDIPVLRVSAGCVALPTADRGKFAGLIEGREESTKAVDAYMNDIIAGIAYTNARQLGVAAAYTKTRTGIWKMDDESKNNLCITYIGWIWNDSPTNETWSFAGYMGNFARVAINGKKVFNYLQGSTSADYAGHGTATLKPGANRFYLGISADTGYGCRTTDMWTKNPFGVGYNRTADDTANSDDYLPLVDPGDGSLFTFANTDEVDVVVPGTGTVLPGGWDLFVGKAICKAGSSIDFAGRDEYTLTNLVGLTSVKGCGQLIVGDWSVDVGELASDVSAKLETEGRLVISDGAILNISGKWNSGCPSEYPIAYAEGGIEMGAVDVQNATGRGSFTLRISDDGKTLYLCRQAPGIMLIVR